VSSELLDLCNLPAGGPLAAASSRSPG